MNRLTGLREAGVPAFRRGFPLEKKPRLWFKRGKLRVRSRTSALLRFKGAACLALVFGALNVESKKQSWLGIGTFLVAWSVAALAGIPWTGHAAVIKTGPTVEFTNGTQAVVRWSTDVSTGSRVFFGPSASQMTRRADGGLGVDHSVVLPALEPGAQWFFTVGTARVPLATNSFTVPGKGIREVAHPARDAIPTKGPAKAARKAPPTRETWAHLPSLLDHFARHGRDFNAKDADDYARMAWEFQQRAKAEGLPAKVDSEGVTRIYDPKSGAFAAYNRDGATKTFFKPNSRDYFDRQPGELVTLKGRE